MDRMKALALRGMGMVLALCAALLSGQAVKAQTPTDLDIVVALDRSESISAPEAVQQIEGLIYTLQHPQFHDAATNGLHGRIGLTVITWSSFTKSEELLPWTIIGGPKDSLLAAAQLIPHLAADDGEIHGTQTDVAFGISQGSETHKRSPFRPMRKVLNMVGDGIANIGRIPEVDRDRAVQEGIVINALLTGSQRSRPYLEAFFRRGVIGGPASFMIFVGSSDQFLEGMLRKFVLEIASLVPPKPASVQ